MLKNRKQKHLEAYDSGIPGKHKTMRKPEFPEIESTLYEWFISRLKKNLNPNKQTLLNFFL
jgi:hypothetical protein